MTKVAITVYSISVQLESALRKKEFKADELAEVYNTFAELKKKQFKSVKILLIVLAVFLPLLIAGCIIGDAGPAITILTAVLYCAGVCVAGYIGWYVNVGKIAKRWNILMKENYPDLAGKFKL